MADNNCLHGYVEQLEKGPYGWFINLTVTFLHTIIYVVKDHTLV